MLFFFLRCEQILFQWCDSIQIKGKTHTLAVIERSREVSSGINMIQSNTKQQKKKKPFSDTHTYIQYIQMTYKYKHINIYHQRNNLHFKIYSNLNQLF